MKFLLDQGMPRSVVQALAGRAGFEAVHVGDVGLAEADDVAIMERATAERRVVVTLDADFHAILAVGGLTAPSVIRIRIEAMRGETVGRLLIRIGEQFAADLEAGAILTVDERRVRVRRLPVVR